MSRPLPNRDVRKIDSRVPDAPAHYRGKEVTAWRFGYEDFLYSRHINRYHRAHYYSKKQADGAEWMRRCWDSGWSHAVITLAPRIPPPSEK